MQSTSTNPPNSITLSRRLYNWVGATFKLKQRIEITHIDFQKPWWNIFIKERAAIIISLLPQGLINVYNSLYALILSWMLTIALQGDVWTAIAIFLGLSLFSLFLNLLTEWGNVRVQANVINSLTYSANTFFLTVDPTFHTTRSSGQIISKVNRASSGFETIMDVFIYDFWRVGISLAAVGISMCIVNIQLGLLAVAGMLIVTAATTYINVKLINEMNDYRITTEDKLKASTVENLSQVQLIRSSFATQIQENHTYNLAFKNAEVLQTLWSTSSILYQVARFVFIISSALVSLFVLLLVQTSQLNTTIALGLLISYTEASVSLLYFGNRVSRLLEKVLDVRDLFTFIRGFGTQTYPVLEHDKIQKQI